MYAKPVNKYPDNPSIILRISSGTEDLPRATVKDVYNQLVVDMEKACGLLDQHSSSSKAYIGANAAHGILARLYLDLGDETNGIKHANAALKGVNLMNTAVYTADFCKVTQKHFGLSNVQLMIINSIFHYPLSGICVEMIMKMLLLVIAHYEFQRL